MPDRPPGPIAPFETRKGRLGRGIGGALALLLLAPWPVLAAADPPVAARSYLDPPRVGLVHADQWVVEVAPTFVYVMRSVFDEAALAQGGFGIDLRLARGLPLSGNELGLHLRPVFLSGASGLMVSGGYRHTFGRERWKTHLELELAIPWIGGPEVGLRVAGGVLREFGRHFALLFDGGAGGAVGKVLLGWLELRAAVQLRF